MTRAVRRLLVFSDTWAPQTNGVAGTLQRLAEHAERAAITMHAVTVADPHAAADARVERWPSRAFWKYPQLRMSAPLMARAAAAIAQFRPDVVHVTTPFGVGLAGRWAARRAGLPLVTSYHTNFPAYLAHYRLDALGAVGWPFLRWFHNGGRRTFVPSETVAAELRDRGFHGVRMWSRGVDPARFHPQFRDGAVRAALGLRPSDVLALHVGRLAPEKSVERAVIACARARARIEGRIVLAIVGDGPSEQSLRALAAGDVDVRFLGRQTGRTLSALYASADLFLSPSETETFGNVVLEAMASALPVVGPASGATAEIVTGESGARYAAGDTDAMAAAIVALASDADRRRAASAAALVRSSTYRWEAIFDGLVAEYALARAEAVGGRGDHRRWSNSQVMRARSAISR
ncbi:MAG: glycosyltransferase family 1 protein [Gemmatimonadaceae bacterium]|nr:glycosyltransferase family 1 protein [Gemmatimonadaceae bacterium]